MWLNISSFIRCKRVVCPFPGYIIAIFVIIILEAFLGVIIHNILFVFIIKRLMTALFLTAFEKFRMIFWVHYWKSDMAVFLGDELLTWMQRGVAVLT